MKAPSEAKANQRKKHNVEKVHSVTYLAFADNTSIVNRLAVVASQICYIPRKLELMAVQGHRSWCQSKAHKQLPISH